MSNYRDNTKIVKIGNKVIGGGNPIMIQSMTNTKTDDIDMRKLDIWYQMQAYLNDILEI